MSSKVKKMPDASSERKWETQLARLHDRLDSPSLVFVPIRHHSPACAWHLRRVIEERRPASILIEGPESLATYLPLLANPELKPPIAIFTSFVDRKRRTAQRISDMEAGGSKVPAPRFGAYFPLCSYSPELVAIREGMAIGARVAFCDLDYPLQILAGNGVESEDTETTATSLLDEHYFVQSEYLRELARRSGCRDTNELWDRKFESAFRGEDTARFWREVAAYCFFARMNAPAAMLRADGTLARERRMHEIVKSEQQRLKRRKETRPLLVVTGGFHTPPLALGEIDENVGIPSATFEEGEILSAPIPYSFIQLDALNGYAAGMPSPGYYQRVWDSMGDLKDVALEVLAELARKTREMGINQALSTADVIAANQQACSVARFRGNPGPLREDLLDGIRSSFVKGSLDAEGDMLLSIAHALLCGEAIGQLPKGTRTHPLVEDFHAQARNLALNLDSSSPKQLDLEVYAKERHQRISRFFRMLEFLNVPFARFQGGPDFVGGHNLELQIEHWTYTWTPQTESALIEVSHFGSSLRDAVVASLLERQRAVANQGDSGGSLEAVTLLLLCCRLGLADQAEALAPFANERIHTETRFTDAVAAAAQLDLLLRYRSPLEASQLAKLPEILAAAFSRACYLVGDFPNLPQELIEPSLEHLPILRETLAADGRSGHLDAGLFWDACSHLLDLASPTLAPALHGGVLGLLWNVQRRSLDEVLASVRAQKDSQDAQGNCLSRFLLGFFTICREATWRDRDFMQEVNRIISEWDDGSFHSSLPELRLAFSQHTPQETDRVGRLVAELYSVDSIGEWYHRDIDEALMLRCSEAAGRLATTLKQDHLSHFLQP
jgi:hypothetical protein